MACGLHHNWERARVSVWRVHVVCVSDAYDKCTKKKYQAILERAIRKQNCAKGLNILWSSSDAICTSNVHWFCILSTYICTFAPHYVYDIWHNEKLHTADWCEMHKTARDRERIRKRVIAQNDIANPEKCNGGNNFLFLLDYIY